MSLSLHPYQSSDFEVYHRLVGDERVMAMITEYGLGLEEAQADFAQLLQNNLLHPELGCFRVIEASTGAYLGLAKLALERADADEAELGYMLLPEYWGQGWGSLIAAHLVEKARGLPQLRRLMAIIDPKHAASRHILVKQGFVTTWLGEYDGLPAEVLHLALD